MGSQDATRYQPLAPETFTSFGTLLLYLRRRARLRQRDLALAVGYSEAQIGRLENDQRLPDVATIMAQFVPALDLESEPELAERLIALAHAARHGATGGESIQPPIAVAAPPERAPDADTAPAAPAPPLDLPLPPTPFLGRADELSQLAAQLSSADQRCVTLTGLGGVGKTRLALEAARRYAGQFAHGTYFVPLAGVASADLLATTIAQALQLTARPSADIAGQLRLYLQDKQLLLTLDNLEHLVEGAELLADLLAAAPGLHILATSRERLHIRGETALEVAGLPVPEAAARVDELSANAAVDLFLSSARRVRHDITSTPDDLTTIARICRLVDGLPLAIELAASWAHMLSYAEIERELTCTLDVLQTTMRDLPTRHRSMRAVFSHSWDLLTSDEQCTLRRLSVFRGSFTRDAAAAVLSVTPALGVLARLSVLVDSSLLKRIGRAGESRYMLHELVRQFAAEHLREDSAEERAVRDSHSRYYRELLLANTAAIRGMAQHQALGALGVEIDNLRAALDWTIATFDVAALRQIMPTLMIFYEWRYTIEEGYTLWRQISARLQTIPPATEQAAAQQAVQALALAYSGWFSFYLGRFDQALTHLRAAHEQAQASRDDLALGDTLLFLGFLTGHTGDTATGRRLLLASVRAFEACGDEWRLARALYRLAMLLHQDGEYVSAQQLFSACLVRLRTLGDPRATALTLNRLGLTHGLLGRYAEAQQCLQESLLHSSAAHDQRGMASTLFHMGALAQQRDDHRAATYFLQESLQLFRTFNERFSVADTLAQISYSAVAERTLSAAREALDQAWQIVRDADVTTTTLSILAGRAALDLADGRVERAVEALTLALYHPVSGQDTRDRAAQLLHLAEARLTPFQFVTAQARGRTASLTAYLP
jgi:predicted ATPase